MKTLARIRRLQASLARCDLAAALQAEAAAAAALTDARQARLMEAAHAAQHTAHGVGGMSGTYASWLPVAAAGILLHQTSVLETSAVRVEAAAEAVACKAALEAIETLMDERAQVLRRAATRKVQTRLDELGLRRR